MLIDRVITGFVVGLLTVLGLFFLSPLALDLVVLVVLSMAMWEFFGLFGWSYQKRYIFLALFMPISIALQFINAIPVLIVGVLWWFVAPYFLWTYTATGNSKLFDTVLKQTLLAGVMFIPCWAGFVTINAKYGAGFLFYLFSLVCAVDIGAYFAGRRWGRHHLAPTISPKKTVEGMLGGIATSMVVAILGLLMFKWVYSSSSSSLVKIDFSVPSSISFLMLSLLVSLWSVIGDLFESLLKRFSGVKDSGSLLPGHGGVYDRLDSLIAAIPIFALGMRLI